MAPKKPVIDSIYDFSPNGMMELVLELQKWFRHRNGPAGPVGPIDSTENVGDLWGVHSTETDGDFEAEGSVLRADGAGGSLWGGIPSGGVTLEDVIRASSLSGFWKFDESSGTTAADSSGNGRDLTAGSFSAPTWAQTAGPPGTQTAAWASDGQALTRASYPSVASADFSVFGWVYLASDSATDNHFLMGQGQNLFGASSVIGWSLGVGGVGSYGRKLLLGLGNNSALDLNIGDNTLSLSTWYHVGFVHASGVSTMYVNGAAQSDTSAQTISTGSQTLKAGSDAILNGIYYLRGRLSWWAIWDTALTAAQVFNQYTVGANPSGAPVGYLIESDGSGSTRWIPADEVALTDITTGNASTSKHGWLKKLSGTAAEAFRGDGTYAAVTDADLSTSDVTTNNATTGKHGFLKKLSGTATEAMNGAGNWIGVVTGLSKSGSTVLTGAVTLTGGSNVTLTQSAQNITIAATVVGSGAVDSLAASGDTPMTGALLIAGGTGVTVTQNDTDTITVTATGAATSYRAVVAADAPAYWWHMADTSGTTMAATNGGVNGTYNGPTLAGTGPGFSGGGVAPSFDGTNDYAQAAINLSSTGDLVIEFWLKWTAYASDDDLALEYGPGGLVAGFYIDPNSSSGTFEISVHGAATARLTRFARPPAGIWHHYTIFLRRTIDAIMYVDGVLSPVTATSGTLQSGNFGNLTLNVMGRNATSLFGAGSMAELAIYTAWPTRMTLPAVHAAASFT